MSLSDDIALLSGAPLLSLLDPEALRLLAFASDRRALEPGEVLFRRGETADGGYVVAAGALALDAGRGEPPFSAGPGTLIGRTALFVPARRPATATALAPSGVLHVSQSLMGRMLREFPDAALRLREALADDLATTAADLGRVRARLLAIDGEG
jgi:CRP-like cAMP-binding protein